MFDDQWNNTVTRIQDTFTIQRHEVIAGDEVTGDLEVIEFTTPQGKMKLERLSKPRIIGRSGLAANRPGSGATIKYEYSKTEKIHDVTAYRWDDRLDDWNQIDFKGGFGNAGER